MIRSGFLRNKFFLVCVVFFVGAFFSASSGVTKFPTPKNLKPNVQFWLDIYTKYSQNQVVIHDAEHIDVIYEIVDFGDFYADSVSFRQKWEKIEKIKKQYKSLFKKLSKIKTEKQIKNLSAEEKRVFDLVQDIPGRNKFYQAGQNIRGQRGLREEFKRGIERSGKYYGKIKQIFLNQHLPVQLCFMPHVESSFNYKARSRAGASGLWQFTRGTGRQYLKINQAIDERSDPILATEAAAKLLKKNYLELETWPLALTAYNHGLNGMKRAVKRVGSRDFEKIVEKYQSPTFKFASRNFYAEFLAACKIMERPLKYFSDLDFEEPQNYIEYELPDYVSFNTICKEFNVEKQVLTDLNPALSPYVLKNQLRIPPGYRLRLPGDFNKDPHIVYAAISGKEKFYKQIQGGSYKVRRGDNLSLIARRANTSVKKLMQLNSLGNANHIYIGQVLTMPFAENKSYAQSTVPSKTVPELTTELDTIEHHEMKEFLFTDIRLLEGDSIIVQPQEDLALIADWLDIESNKLSTLNDLAPSEKLLPNTIIAVDFSNTTKVDFLQKRNAFHHSQSIDFLTDFCILGTRVYQMQRGDKINKLCSTLFEIPMWLLVKFNPDIRIADLKPGHLIVVPIISPFNTNA